MVYRREFLGTLAACAAWGQTSAQSKRGANSRLIDVHHHLLPDFWKKAANIPNAWSLEGSLAAMDQNGVSTSILSYTAPAVSMPDVAAARSLARQSNEYAAKLGQNYPGRFGLFATIPLPDTDGSLREIEYALDTLKADGVGLMTNYNDKWPGDPAFARVFEELNRRKAVVYFHPAGASCCASGLIPGVRPQLIEFPHDSTRAAVSLLVTGSLAKFRDIKFIFSHGGGTIPYLAGRVETMNAKDKQAPKYAPQGIGSELRRLYFEIAAGANPVAMAALMKFVPLEQIMFGTDYPFVSIEATADGMYGLGLSKSQLTAISRDNAGKLLPRWKS
jgi:predicted TIM-barrel fold metal-dependent hydrolase